jgi:hypothetical protein
VIPKERTMSLRGLHHNDTRGITDHGFLHAVHFVIR